MNPENLIAIDTHVHIEPDSRDTAADQAARKYFGETGPAFGRDEIAEYYRARNIGCVVFSVDERMTGRQQVPNEDVLALATKHSDVMIAFASVDPMRGADAVGQRRRQLVTARAPPTSAPRTCSTPALRRKYFSEVIHGQSWHFWWY